MISMRCPQATSFFSSLFFFSLLVPLVTPLLQLRWDDQHALSSCNFELGSWIFLLLLGNGPGVAKEAYAIDLYDALVWYVSFAILRFFGKSMQQRRSLKSFQLGTICCTFARILQARVAKWRSFHGTIFLIHPFVFYFSPLFR